MKKYREKIPYIGKCVKRVKIYAFNITVSLEGITIFICRYISVLLFKKVPLEANVIVVIRSLLSAIYLSTIDLVQKAWKKTPLGLCRGSLSQPLLDKYFSLLLLFV